AETLERHALLSVEELQPKVERLKLENSSTVLGLRKELKEGVPCRVCGSIEHPFAEKPGESSLISQAEDELAKAKKQHTDRQQKLAELRQNKSAEEAKQQALTEGLARNQEHLKKRLTERDELRDRLEARGISGEAEEWKEKLATEMKSVRKIEKYPDLLQTFGRIGKALRSWKTSEKQWKALLEPYASYSEQLPELKNYSREFLDIKENAEKLKQRLAGAESLRENLQKSFLEETKSLQHAQGEFQLKRELLNSQKETRRTLFGDKSVEQDQKAYFEGVESLRKAVQEVKEQRASAEAEAKSVAGQCQDGKAAVQEQEEFVGSAKTELEEALREKGYASLSELESALGLSGADVLREERGALERETTELRTAREMKENEQKLIVERLNREERQEEEIRAAFSQQQDELTKIQEESAGEKAKLEISARNERQAKEISKQISRQEADLKVWATLNEMIGSATGDKFNDYAQSLMLGIMLEYANKHLNSISPRYRFVTRRGRGSTDELFVKDLEMGGEVRAVRTLSGGETFLLSLSLALGLSDMASQQVRIESLFIDEGFGTLDKDTLEDALCTLETLQNETNKKIMIISHVPELQERIGAQIRLKKVGGGYSKVEI
ncbi:MAG: hypothetical protein MI784_03500, partial [Cytophagales bacterium]|nr:hypothetical protein [Cytophagales bacterium]